MQLLLVSWHSAPIITVRSSVACAYTCVISYGHVVEQYLQTPVQLEHACSLLLHSELFSFHSERMRERLLEDAEKVHAGLLLVRLGA